MSDLNWTCRGLDRLDAELRGTTSPHHRRLLLVKKACMLARLSFTEQAQSILAGARAPVGAYDPEISAWIMFCEGLIEHFGTLGDKALSAFRRAHAVSVSVGDRELAALSLAWIANGELIAGNFASVPSLLGQAFSFAGDSNETALARGSLVIADMYSWSGQPNDAKPWYRRAREHAVQDGDISMQSVVLFNDAAFRVANVVLQDCGVGATERDVLLASLAVDSVGNLDHGLGVRRLTSMVPLLRAEVSTVQKRWDEAIGLFDAFLADKSVHTHGRLRPKFLAQRAYCWSMLGNHAESIRDIEHAIESSVVCTEFDDLFVLHTRASQVLASAGKTDAAALHAGSASRCEAAFHELQIQVQEAVTAAVERIAGTSIKKNPA